MYEKWRKYGEWDYNQIGFSNRDFTQFNFGATGAAAKIDKDSLTRTGASVQTRSY
jgi:hypothetical protein